MEEIQTMVKRLSLRTFKEVLKRRKLLRFRTLLTTYI